MACPSNKILNPATNRCVLKNGKVGKRVQLLKNDSEFRPLPRPRRKTTPKPPPRTTSKKKKRVATAPGPARSVGSPMLAKKVEDYPKTSFIGWWVSEKFDGFRAIWDGKNFKSRGNNIFAVPPYFSACMPSTPLDGELWLGRASFGNTGLLRRKTANTEEWKNANVQYMVYDLPASNEIWSKRLKDMKNVIIKKNCPHAKIVKQTLVTSQTQLDSMMKKILKEDGEGLMLKDPNGKYENKRSKNLLKMKPLYDDEAIVIGYKAGSGKYASKLGSFKLEWKKKEMGKKPFFASGMNDTIRNNYKTTHPIGTVVTINYASLMKTGSPRHPVYARKYVNF